MENKIFWLTGLPCAGKTTIAKELARQIHAEILDGDDIRKITGNNDFSEQGRKSHVLAVAEFAGMLSRHVDVVVALVSPVKEIRERIKKKFPNLLEIYVKASLKTCKKRDVKGMYKLAMEGKIKNFTGISSPYEIPKNPAVAVDTEKLGAEQCARLIIEKCRPRQKYSLFIGRWQPLHKGHLALFEKVRQEGKKILIGVRNTGIGPQNPYSVQERIEMIKKQVPDAGIIVVPDIESVCYGRKVGYEIKEIKLEKNWKKFPRLKLEKIPNTFKFIN